MLSYCRYLPEGIKALGVLSSLRQTVASNVDTPSRYCVCVCVCVCVCRSSHYSKRTHSSKRKYHSPSMCVCVCLCVPFHRGGARARGGVDAQYQYGILNTNGIIIIKINSAAWHGDSSGEKKSKKCIKNKQRSAARDSGGGRTLYSSTSDASAPAYGSSSSVPAVD